MTDACRKPKSATNLHSGKPKQKQSAALQVNSKLVNAQTLAVFLD